VIVITAIRVAMIVVAVAVIPASTAVRDDLEFGAASAIDPHLAALHSVSAALYASGITVLPCDTHAIVRTDVTVVPVHVIGVARDDALRHGWQTGSRYRDQQEHRQLHKTISIHAAASSEPLIAFSVMLFTLTLLPSK
jgi:hypothetical protein